MDNETLTKILQELQKLNEHKTKELEQREETNKLFQLMQKSLYNISNR